MDFLNGQFFAGCGFVMLALLWAHSFAWYEQLKRTDAYVVGVAIIFLGITIWLYPSPLLVGVWAFPVIGGIVVKASYYYDKLRNRAVNDEADSLSGQRRPS